MAFEGLKNLSAKQKILLPIFVLALIYVIWQVYDMFGGGAVQPAPVVAAKPVVVMQTQPMAGAPSSQMQAQEQMPAALGQNAPGAPAQLAPTEKSVVALAATSGGDDQSQYVQLLNHYQLLKMKRLLLEEEVAISTAQQKIAEMNAKTVSLGGMPDTGVEDMGGYSDSAMAATAPSNSEGGGSGDYKVVYIDKQGGDWNATLNRKGRFEEVTIGSELTDGTQVISIDSTGVVIKHGMNLTKLTFGGAVAIPNAEAKGTEVEQPAQTVPVKSVTLQEAQRVGDAVITPQPAKPAVVKMESIKKKHKIKQPQIVVPQGVAKEIPAAQTVAQPAAQSLPAETIIPVQSEKSAITVPIKSTAIEAAPLKPVEVTTVATAEKKILKLPIVAHAKTIAAKNLSKTELTIAPLGRAKVIVEKKTKLVVGLETDPNRKVVAAAKALPKQPGGDVPIAISSNKPRGIGKLACKDHNCGFVPQVDVPTAESNIIDRNSAKQKIAASQGQSAVQNPDEEIKKLVQKLQDQKGKHNAAALTENDPIPNNMMASATPAMNEPVLILSKRKPTRNIINPASPRKARGYAVTWSHGFSRRRRGLLSIPAFESHLPNSWQRYAQLHWINAIYQA